MSCLELNTISDFFTCTILGGFILGMIFAILSWWERD